MIMSTKFTKKTDEKASVGKENPGAKADPTNTGKDGFEGDFFRDFYYSQGDYNEAKCQEKVEQSKQ